MSEHSQALRLATGLVTNKMSTNVANIYEPVEPSHRILYKSVDNCQHGGPSMDIMLPENVQRGTSLPIVM